MRIDKTIKEFIRNSVTAKAATKVKNLTDKLNNTIKTRHKEYDKGIADVEKEMSKALTKLNADLDKAMKKHNIICRGWDGEPRKNCYELKYTLQHFDVNYDKEVVKCHKELDDFNDKVEDTIKDIIVRTTLGGNYDELKEMLASVKF